MPGATPVQRALSRPPSGWNPSHWNAICQAVNEEFDRQAVWRKFLPLQQSSDALRVSADVTVPDPNDRSRLIIDSAQTVPMVELVAEFLLSEQQFSVEHGESTVLPLAMATATNLALAEGIVLFQGEAASRKKIFRRVRIQRGPASSGLLNANPPPVDVPAPFGPNAFRAVTGAISRLTAKGQVGPFVALFHTDFFAELFVPVENTLLYAAQLIQPLVPAGFYATPALARDTALVASLGGQAISLAEARRVTPAFTFRDAQGYHFQLSESIALVLRRREAVVALKLNR
jgi:uncharacterized linocin/CFP29 family protein